MLRLHHLAAIVPCTFGRRMLLAHTPPTSERPARVLFVCTGNICRSPLAEVYARAYAEDQGLHIEVQSAGTMPGGGAAASSKMQRAGAQLDLDLSEHSSQSLSEELIDWADHVLAMEMAHMILIRELYPSVGEKALLLGTFAGTMEIADPHGSWFMGPFRRARDQITTAVERFLDTVVG
jgi:protein arginine phosphatase